MTVKNLVLWQFILSPHMLPLAYASCRLFEKVSYLINKPLNDYRKDSGWDGSADVKSTLNIVRYQNSHDFYSWDDPSTVHIFPGLRGSGPISRAFRKATNLHLNNGIAMESVDLRRNRLIKEIVYHYLINRVKTKTDFALAIGDNSKKFLVRHKFPESKIFDFTYFIDENKFQVFPRAGCESELTVGFVGRLVSLKRLDLLIKAIANLRLNDVRLKVVGVGPMKEEWMKMAQQLIPDVRVEWLGLVGQADMPSVIGGFDCLVLPSEYDGWGAVVTESLLCGVPVVCSDACGASGAVSKHKQSAVFESGSFLSLANALKIVLSQCVSERNPNMVREGALYLGAQWGANYLRRIVDHVYDNAARPVLHELKNDS